MKRNALLLMGASMMCLPVMAASTPDVKGQIIDETGEPMPFVNIVLLNAQDSTFVQGSTSDVDGNFLIATPKNQGLLKVSSVGYQTLFFNVDATGKTSIENNIIRMQEDQQLLDEVVVKSQLPKTKLTGRSMVTSISGSVLEKVGNAEDVLGKVPGVMKGPQGLEVIGKGAPLIYINGRKLHDKDELKRLRSEEILEIEVINNPGAQYDATVSAVIRIKTIRRQGDGFGFNAGITDEQSLRDAKINDPFPYLNMNWRHGDVDIFAGASYLRWHNRQQSEMLQESFGVPFRQEGTLDYRMEQRQAEFNLGANWQISDKHSVGVRVENSYTGMTRIRQSLIEDMKYDGQLIDHIDAYGHHDPCEDPNSMKINAYYNGSRGKLGIDLNADYYLMNSSQLANTDEVSTQDGASTVITDSHSKNQLWASKLVLSYPLWQGMLQAGTEETFSRRHEDYTIGGTNYAKEGSSSLIPTTDSEVKEDNYALFVEYGLQLPRVGQLSAGLRYEHVRYTYDSDFSYSGTTQNGHDNIERTNDNFFPSLSWANAFMVHQSPMQLSLSYSMKTTRPDFYQLNSAIRYHSRYVWQSGNAALQNQTDHDVSLNVRWKVLMLIAQYNCKEDAISQWSSLINDNGIVLVKTCNLNDPVHTANIYLNASPTFGCWTMNYTVGMQKQWFETMANDPRVASGQRKLSFSDKTQFVAQLNNTWTFGARKDGTGAWMIELGGTLQTHGYTMNTEMTNDYFNLTAAIQKSMLKNDALTLRIEGTDLTRTSDYDVATDCGSHLVKQTNQFDQCRVKFSASYSFNASRSKYKGTGAGTDAQRRMKQ